MMTIIVILIIIITTVIAQPTLYLALRTPACIL